MLRVGNTYYNIANIISVDDPREVTSGYKGEISWKISFVTCDGKIHAYAGSKEFAFDILKKITSSFIK